MFERCCAQTQSSRHITRQWSFSIPTPNNMRRLTLFLAGVAIVGNLAIAQDNWNLGLPAPARGATTPKTASDPGVTQPSNVKSANVYDPQGLRLELNELIPESQTKKAMDAWK